MHSFRELKIWQKGVDLAVQVYKATASFPREEMYGITSQIRRAAVSIPSNIAEGAGRNSSPDFVRFLSMAYGSSCELETQLIIAQKLSFIEANIANEFINGLQEIQKMNYSLQEKIKSEYNK